MKKTKNLKPFVLQVNLTFLQVMVFWILIMTIYILPYLIPNKLFKKMSTYIKKIDIKKTIQLVVG